MFVINFSLPSINSIILSRAFISAQFSSPPLTILQNMRNILYRQKTKTEWKNRRLEEEEEEEKKERKKNEGSTLDTGHSKVAVFQRAG